MDTSKPYTVYILWSDEGNRFYIGVTADVKHRLTQHNAGDSRWTKRYAGTWVLLWQEICPDLSAARKLESELKRQKSGQGFFARTGLKRRAGSSGS
jgi:predicted GIY-YIG superfamily endonuclease